VRTQDLANFGFKEEMLDISLRGVSLSVLGREETARLFSISEGNLPLTATFHLRSRHMATIPLKFVSQECHPQNRMASGFLKFVRYYWPSLKVSHSAARIDTDLENKPASQLGDRYGQKISECSLCNPLHDSNDDTPMIS
jgi:hypothetical protein